MRQATLDHPPPATRVAVHPFARWAVLPITAAVFVAQFVASFAPGFWFDEVYMLSIGRLHLDWGSADQPPVTPLLAAVMDVIAPGSIVALRLPAVLATAAAVLVAALIARELGGDRRAQAITACAQATGLWFTMAGHWLTPYTLEPITWLVLFWLLVRWLRVRRDGLLLAVGAVVGLAAETKFQVLLLCAVLVGSVLLFGPRDLLRRPLLWAGAAIAVIVAAPTLLWQAANGWPQLQMGAVATAEAEYLYGGRPGVAVALIIMAGVAGTVLGIYGTGRLLRAPELRFLGMTAVVLFVFFVVTAGRPYYLNGLYGLLAAAGAVGLQVRREAGRRRLRWVVWPAFALSTAAAGGMLVLSSTMTTPEVPTAIVARTAAAYHALTPAEQARTTVMGASYIYAAYVDGYGPGSGLPAATSTNRAYGYFAPPPETQDQVLYIGTPDELRPWFATISQVGEDTWLCTGRQQPWSVIWPKLRNLTV